MAAAAAAFSVCILLAPYVYFIDWILDQEEDPGLSHFNSLRQQTAALTTKKESTAAD